MIPTEPRKLVVSWITNDQNAIEAIRLRFNIPHYTTVNGWSPAEIKPEDWELFQECENRKFIRIIDVKWRKNGKQYSFKSR